MFGLMNLELARIRRDELHKESDARRMAARSHPAEPQRREPRRILGLRIRLSPA